MSTVKTHNFENSFSGRLSRLLEGKGLSQDGLRLLLGSNSTGLVSNWIKRNRPPNAEMLLKLAKVLDTTPGYLVHGEIPESERDGNLNETAQWKERALKAEKELGQIKKAMRSAVGQLTEMAISSEKSPEDVAAEAAEARAAELKASAKTARHPSANPK